jgi:DNA-binding XRE family transcriptional regulator
MTPEQSNSLAEAGKARALADREAAAARAWRKRMGLTMAELAQLTGYSPEALFLFEKGHTSSGKPHAEHSWRRYKLACLAVRILRHYKLSSVEDWNWQA